MSDDARDKNSKKPLVEGYRPGFQKKGYQPKVDSIYQPPKHVSTSQKPSALRPPGKKPTGGSIAEKPKSDK